MNLQSLLMNAYKNGAKKTGDSEPILQSSNDAHVVSKPIFPKIEKSSVGEKKDSVKINQQIPKTTQIVPPQPQKTEQDVSAAVRALTSGGLLKVPELPRDSNGKENIYRRVAKFLLLIGVDEAAKILPRLSEAQVEKIIPEIASIRKVEPDEATEILEEFQSLMVRAREDGGVETARSILQKAFGPSKAERLLQNVAENAPIKPFEYLAEADAERVSFLLKDESNAVRALVLSYLNPKVSAEVIRSLPMSERKDLFLRLASLKQINPDVLRQVDNAMHEKVKKMSVEKSDTIDGRATLAQILRKMDLSAEEEILGALSESDAELGADLRERLFTSEDVVNADDRFIQEYLRKMDDNDIAFLIAGKDEAFKNKILSNVSQSRAKEIEKTGEILRPIKRSEVEKITGKFVADMRKAYDSGDLVVSGRDGEQYV